MRTKLLFAALLGFMLMPATALAAPRAVAVGPTGSIWIAEEGKEAGSVTELNASHEHVRELSLAGEQGPYWNFQGGVAGIATNASGDVYVVNSGKGVVQEFGPEGAYVRQFAAGNANAIAVDSAGNVWVADWGCLGGGYIAEYSSTGAHESQFAHPGIALSISFSEGHLYVAELTGVQEFSSTGGLIRRFDSERGSGNGESYMPWGIATDPETGDLYVSEFGNDRMQEFSPEGGFIAAFGERGTGVGQLLQPKGIAVGPSHNVFVANSGDGRVTEWGDNGWQELP